MNEIPTHYKMMVGTRVRMEGAIFSRNPIPETEFDVIGVRWGSSQTLNTKTMKRYPTVEFLVKNNSMKRARWTGPFPDYSNQINDDYIIAKTNDK